MVTAETNNNNIVEPKTYTYVINANEVTILSLNNANPTYNGEAYVPSCSYVMSKDVDITNKLTYTITSSNTTNNLAVNAGDYTIEVGISDANYLLKNNIVYLHIKPIDIEVAINNREEYYGDEFDVQDSSCEIGKGIISGEKLELVYTIEDYENVAGKYVLNAENLNKNYNATITPAVFTVKQRELTLKYSGESVLTFDEIGYADLLTVQVENALTNDVYTIYYQNENKQQITSIVDAGTYYLVVKLNDTQNYKFKELDDTVVSSEIKISKQLLELDIKIESKIYDGNHVNFNGVYVGESLVSDDIYEVQYLKNNVIVSQPKDAGEYTIKITEKVAKNYTFSNNTKDFEINQESISIKLLDQSSIYGNSISLNQSKFEVVEGCIYNNAEGVQDILFTLTTSATKDNNVGEYAISVENKNTNYSISIIQNANYIITAKEVEIDFFYF